MATGWIKLHRKLKDWEWYCDHNTTRLFVHLLLSVNAKEGEHQGTVIPVGCIKTGRKELAQQTGLTEQKIRRSLNNLQTSGDITIKPTNKFSVITIEKWGEYQSSPEKATNKTTHKQPTNAPQNNHKQEEEKKEQSIYTEEFEMFWSVYPKKRGKGGAFNSWQKIKHRPKTELIIQSVNSEKETDQWKKANGQFIPMPQTWINQRRWDDSTEDDLFSPFSQNGTTVHGQPTCNGLTRDQFIEKYGKVS